MGSGKSGGGSKDYYGHAAGLVCCGQLDFIWGLLINNELAWPKAKLWDSQTFKKGKTVIYTDGNVYQALEKTQVDPPTFPWTLFAVPWVTGSYDEEERVLKDGHVWQAVETTSGEPPDTPPIGVLGIAIEFQTPVDGWVYVSSPQTWASQASTPFWEANQIVAWRGRLYQTPADTKAEPPNAPWVLWKSDRSASPNPLKFTVPNGGDAFLYWGTATQTLDASDEAILSALGHPPYRHRAILMLKNFLFGSMRITPPDVVVLGGRVPQQSLITGSAALMDADWQVNPWCVLAELLTHPVIGLGLPLSWFDQASWQAEADWCYTRSSLTYISPLYSSVQKVRSLVADLLGYPDAFLFWSTVATLVAGHWPHGEAAPAFTAATTIDRNDLVAEIDAKSDGWGGTANSTVLSFDDVQAAFKTRPVIAGNLFNMSVVRRVQSQRIERPHITRFSQASAWAAEMAKVSGEQINRGTLSVRAEKASAINPGSIFLLTDDEFQTSEPQRCTRKVISAPPTGTVKLTYETERGISPQPYSPAPPDPTEPQGPPPAAITNAVFVQIPTALGTGPNQIACLAERRNELTSSFETWFQQADQTAFQLLGRQDSFAIPGRFAIETGSSELDAPGFNNFVTQVIGPVTAGQTYQLSEKHFWFYQADYSDSSSGTPAIVPTPQEGVDFSMNPDTGEITIIDGGIITTGKYIVVRMNIAVMLNVSPSVGSSDLEDIYTPLTEDQVDDGHLLLFAFQAANPGLYEIMKVRFVTIADTGVLAIKVQRSASGTPMGGDGSYVFSEIDPAFIVFRSGITPLEHAAFPGLIRSGGTVKFRVTPQSAWVTADIDDQFDVANNPGGLSTEFNIMLADVFTPRITWVQLQKNGVDITDLSATFLTTDVFSFNFDIIDRNGDLAQATLTASLGIREITLWTQNFENSVRQNRTVEFSLPTAGLWRISLNVRDGSGNSASYPLTAIGGSDEAQLQVEPPSTATAPSPIIYQKTVAGNYVWSLDFGWLPAGATVKYQLQNRGVAFNPASWSTAPAHGVVGPGGKRRYGYVPAFLRTTKTLYAFVQISGQADSPVVQWNF